MTTPSQPTLALSTDKATYNVGDPLTLTVDYSDVNVTTTTMTISASFSDSNGNTITGNTTVDVVTSGPEAMDGTATDSFGDTYNELSNDQTSTAVFTTTVGTPPSA